MFIREFSSVISARGIGARARIMSLHFPPRSRRRSSRGPTLAEVLQIPSVVALAAAPVEIAVARGGRGPSPLLEPPTPRAIRSLTARRPPSLRLLVELEIGEFAHGQVRVGLSEVFEYSSTQVWVRKLNLRCPSENRTSRRTCCNSGEPDKYRNRTHEQHLPRP